MSEKTGTQVAEKLKEPVHFKRLEFISSADYYYGPPDTSYDNQEDTYEVPDQKKFPYTSFDPRVEFSKLKSRQAKVGISKKEIQKFREEQITPFKENLALLTRGVTKTIDTLFETINNDPNISKQKLKKIIMKNASVYKFPQRFITHFKDGVNEYVKKHKAVDKYYAQYNDPNSLYKVCFGRSPKGAVEVIKGPMTLFFKCATVEDFAFIRTYSTHKGDESKFDATAQIPKNTIVRGCAVREVSFPPLNNTATAENVSQTSKTEWKKMSVLTTIHNQSLDLSIQDQQTVSIDIQGGDFLMLQVTERDANQIPTEFQLTREKAGTDRFFLVYRVKRINPTPDMLAHHNYLGVMQKTDTGDLHYNLITPVDINGKMALTLDVNNCYINISDTSPMGTKVWHTEHRVVTTPDPVRSKELQDHEDQHQFDKLFEPLEATESEFEAMARAIGSHENPDTALKNLVYQMVKHERKMIGIDAAARDEILAKYRGGRKIYEILLDLKLPNYDYKEQDYYKEKIALIAKKIVKNIKDEVSVVSYTIDQEEGTYSTGAVAASVTESDVENVITQVFGPEYFKDVGKWLSAITLLKKKGYSKSEILNILYTERANSWTNVARRKKHKINP